MAQECVRLRNYTAEVVQGSAVRGGDLKYEEVICGPTLFDAILTAVLQGYRSNYNFLVIEHPEDPNDRHFYWNGRIKDRYLAGATDREELERLILDRLAKMGIPHRFEDLGAAKGGGTPTYDTIRQAMADLIWVDAWASALEERGERPGGPGVDLMDVAPATPESAVEAADKVIASIGRMNGKSIDELLANAAQADGDPDLANSADYANRFGHALGFMVLGHGVSWFDDHTEFPLRKPWIEAMAFEDEETGAWQLDVTGPDERFGSLASLPPSDTWLVAYQERESYDPQTGEPGILRAEWRVRLVGDFTPEELRAAWGDDWQHYKPFASHVLEHRYIRRGVEEPWKPFDAANSFKQAIEYIDDKAIAVDPQLEEIQRARREYAAEQEAKAHAKREAEAAAKERHYHQGRSDDAFRKLNSSKWSSLAERWNAFVAAHDSREYREQAKNDPEFMRLYSAVMDAETVPAKRKAIREDESEEPQEEEAPEEPDEGDLVTSDHWNFYQYGKHVLTIDKDAGEEEMWAAIDAYQERTGFFSNVWFISDHGNAHIMIR